MKQIDSEWWDLFGFFFFNQTMALIIWVLRHKNLQMVVSVLCSHLWSVSTKEFVQRNMINTCVQQFRAISLHNNLASAPHVQSFNWLSCVYCMWSCHCIFKDFSKPTEEFLVLRGTVMWCWLRHSGLICDWLSKALGKSAFLFYFIF